MIVAEPKLVDAYRRQIGMVLATLPVLGGVSILGIFTYTEAGKALFGALGDSAPDRWGRVLMQRAERKTSQQQGRAARAPGEIDFLLMVDEEARQGALRFAEQPGWTLRRAGGRRTHSAGGQPAAATRGV